MNNDGNDSQVSAPSNGSALARRPLRIRSLTSLSREIMLLDSRFSQMSSTAGVTGTVGAFVGYLGNLHSNWSLIQLLSKIAGSEREYCVLGSEQIDDLAFLSLETDTQRSLLREQLAKSEPDCWWSEELIKFSGKHRQTLMVSLDSLGFRQQGMRPEKCDSGWCAGHEGLLGARVKKRLPFAWGDFVGVRDFKVLGYRSGPGDLVAISGELFLSLDSNPVVIDVERMRITWLDADTQDFGETLDCHFELGSRPKTEAMFLAVRVFTYNASQRPARPSSETSEDAFRSLKLCTGNSEKILRAYLGQLRNLTSGQETPTRDVLLRRAGLGGERGPLLRTTTKKVLDRLEREFLSDDVPSEPILSFQVLAPDAGMRAAAAAAKEIANSCGVKPKEIEDKYFTPVVACLGESVARRLPEAAKDLAKRSAFPVLTTCSLGLAVALPSVETVYIAPRLESIVSPSHLVPYRHSTGEVVARLPQILNILRLDQNPEYMEWLLQRVKDDATCVTTLGGAGGYDVLMRHLDGSEWSMRTLYDEAFEMAEGFDGKRLGTLCISALKANGAVYGSGTHMTCWLDAVAALRSPEERNNIVLTLDAGIDLAGEEVVTDKGDFLSVILQGGSWWQGKFLKISFPDGAGKWAGSNGPDRGESSLQGGGEMIYRGGEAIGRVSVCSGKRDPQLSVRYDKLLV